MQRTKFAWVNDRPLIERSRSGRNGKWLFCLSAWLVSLCVNQYVAAVEPTLVAGKIVPEFTKKEIDQSSRSLCSRDPKQFWQGRKVTGIQKDRIVIPDLDYIIRDQYWFLSKTAVGKVEEVRVGDRKGTVCVVLFKDMTGWEPHSINEEKKIEVRRTDEGLEITVTKGIPIDSKECGLKVGEGIDGIRVEFPAALLAWPWPRVGDKVIRGPDWFNGYADGGTCPFGVNSDDPKRFFGRVEDSTDSEDERIIKVHWDVTGRTSGCRFGQQNFYEVEQIEPDE